MRDEKLKNIREIDMHMSYDIMDSYNHSEIVTGTDNGTDGLGRYMKALHDTSLAQFKHPEVQNLIHNESEHFDLLMIEVVYPAHIGFVERWKVPLIGMVSLDASLRYHQIMGNIIHPVLNPDYIMSFRPPLTFTQRIISVIAGAMLNLYGYWVTFPSEDETVKEIFGPNSKPLWELTEKMDMLFTNVNPLFHNIRAVTPNTIQFGGAIHLPDPKPLPEYLKSFLDSSTDGVIYFSLGTNVKSNLLDGRILKILIETFSELSYKVLWKFENDEMLNKPENVFIRKWLPQSDILRHPNVKLFITQCGLQSMEEAIFSHIPMIGIPFFGDQKQNGVTMERRGFGIKLDHNTMTKQELKSAIQDVITNPQYKENVIEMANLMSDSEMTGLEKAVWWTEYVIRNKGAEYLKSPHQKVPVYQQFLLDVIGFILLTLITLILITKKIFSLLFKNKKIKQKIT
ncbi:hypothetical protein WA026_003794 [Henosepilachna vigintioctopunctata]|uniref:UDP-glucuronosyltransferase n=1 Tax=Henosepilachna vigintioctopunctata TaxID=420089 RepID=A0AAW1UFQ6_9CUCU